MSHDTIYLVQKIFYYASSVKIAIVIVFLSTYTTNFLSPYLTVQITRHMVLFVTTQVLALQRALNRNTVEAG